MQPEGYTSRRKSSGSFSGELAVAMNNILIVDDDQKIRSVLSEILQAKGFSAIQAAGGKQSLELVRKAAPDVILLDLKMPGMDGMETLAELKIISPDIPIIIITAHGDVPTAVDAIKSGAYDFLVKPPDFDHLLIVVRRAIEKRVLEMRVQKLGDEMDDSFEWMLGRSDSMKKIHDQIRQVAWSDFSVVIQGETGTGKTYIANLIHNLSERKKGPFVTVDMGALPEALVESELFGHERGAFTGADRRKKGLFEIAGRGTILIDEVQNMSLYVQGKLLRIVEERKCYPLGSTKPIDIDARIIAATNANIRQAVQEKRFREDLFFRLGEYMISIPPLRERADDIPFLALKFCSEAAMELKKNLPSLSKKAEEALKAYPWPGNIRELKNVIRRSVLSAGSDIIGPEGIEFLASEKEVASGPGVLNEPPNASLLEIEKRAIQRTLNAMKGNKKKTASILQIDYSTLMRKIKQFNIN
jgi:two-component system, NtrC family, response regulator AtoC